MLARHTPPIAEFPALYSRLSMLQKEIHSLCGMNWAAYRIYCALRRGRTGQLVDSATDVVIEGYGSSANTFAVAAFRFAQRQSINIAHHTHVPSQVITAVKRGLPTIVLLRHPDSIVPSAVSRLYPSQSLYRSRSLLLKESINQVLKQYTRFYSKVLPYRAGFIVALFEDVKRDYGSVISRLNRRFGVEFVPFSGRPDDVKACMREVGGAKPTPEREGLKELIREELHSGGSSRLQARAIEIYERIVEAGNDEGS